MDLWEGERRAAAVPGWVVRDDGSGALLKEGVDDLGSDGIWRRECRVREDDMELLHRGRSGWAPPSTSLVASILPSRSPSSLAHANENACSVVVTERRKERL